MYWKLFGICNLIIVVLLFALPAFALDYDLSIRTEDISWIPTEPVANQPFRVYAKVRNVGSKDVAAAVTFFQGPIVIGTSQVVSVRAGGLEDEVYVDWKSPAGQFNILARIQMPDPQDDDMANNEAVSAMITPLLDTDGDGIPDRDDPDQDNDTVPNTTEATKGTNPLAVDTDGDTVDDAKDAFPLDVQKSVAPPPPPARVLAQPVMKKAAPPPPVVEVMPEAPREEVALPEGRPEKKEAPWIRMTTERRAWNRFTFRFTTNIDDLAHAALAWDFGDKMQSSDTTVTHAYGRPGAYTVRLTLITRDGATLTDMATVSFSFFHPGNRRLWGVVLVLAILGCIPFLWTRMRR
ncbi:PKD domain-containing protein, partial [Candidatus Uhrbacteria bacterium]|nr:PKD domain-containing protein [Candidatus Uhrbacteria bacterium]